MKLSKIIILFLPIFLMITSCKVYKLNIDDTSWQPYKKGDVLVFKDSNGVSDTIYVKSSNTRKSKTINPYGDFDPKYEVNSSNGELNNREVTIINSQPKLFKRDISLIHISRKKDNAYIGFSKYTHPANNDIYVPISEMDKYAYNDKSLGKYYEIKDLDNYYNGSNLEVKSILFSKKYGYLKFNFKDGKIIELKEFIRNGLNIFPQY